MESCFAFDLEEIDLLHLQILADNRFEYKYSN